MNYKELKKRLRDISLLDRLCSKIFTRPISQYKYDEIYDEWLTEFLDSDPDMVVEVPNIYRLVLKSKSKGEREFLTYGYPYRYGNEDVVVGHPRHRLYPSWKNIIRLRELQLTKKDEVLKNYRDRIIGA